MTTNETLSRIFSEMASALELLGANPFRAVSNQRVSRELLDLTEDVGALVREDPATAVERLSALPGIGKGSAEKIVEFVEKGEVDEHRKLLGEVPSGLFDVLEIPGIGPKAARAMWQGMGIESLADLEARIDDPAFAELPRMGRKTIENIKKAMRFQARHRDRIPLGTARPMALAVRDLLSGVEGVRHAEVAGSLRRGRETIGDLDFVVVADDPARVAEVFANAPGVTEILARGDTKCSVRLEREGVAMQADLRLVPAEAFGAAMIYFTGSKDHNVRLRERAVERGMRLNEYGLFATTEERPQDRGFAPVAAATEEEVYSALGLPCPPPELREDRGELDGPIPRLVTEDDIRADLHTHTVASDGKLDIEALAAAARSRGLETIAITDHSVSQVLANGLDAGRLLAHIEAVRAADAAMPGIKILAGAEVDILPDGSLDYDDELLARLDLVVASPHAALRQPPAEATARLLRAVRHPRVHILGHPTGRLLDRREGLEPDMSVLFEAAREHRTALEVNANPQRLDLRDNHVRGALARGCWLAIDTDAHRAEHFAYLVYGVLTARRGGLGPESCVNAWPQSKLLAWLESKR